MNQQLALHRRQQRAASNWFYRYQLPPHPHELSPGGQHHHELTHGGQHYHDLSPGGQHYHDLSPGGLLHDHRERRTHVSLSACRRLEPPPTTTTVQLQLPLQSLPARARGGAALCSHPPTASHAAVRRRVRC